MMKDGKAFKFIMTIFFIIFITLYVSQASGYYDYQQHKKVELTAEKIKQFEQDVKEGKDIDVKDYLEINEYKYRNGISRTGLNLSKNVSSYVKKGVDGVLYLLEKLLTD